MSGKVKRAATVAGQHGAGQAAAQLVVWLLELMLGPGTVPPEIAVAIGVLIGAIANRVNRLLKPKEGTQMKMFSVVLLAFMVAPPLAGCSVVGQPITEKVADVVSEYCEREPLHARELYRSSINAELAGEGHQVAVRCAGDPEEGG